MTPGAKLRTALIVGLALWAGIDWFMGRDDARVERCREVGIESQQRLDRCRESAEATREEIEAQKEARRRERRRQVLQRFADARSKLGHTTSYAQEARQADGTLPQVLKAAGLKNIELLVDVNERDPARIRAQEATIRTRLEVDETDEGRVRHTIVWSEDPADRQGDGTVGTFSLVYADVSALTKAERDLIQDACQVAFASVIYGKMGCPVIVSGHFDLEDSLDGRQNQLMPEQPRSAMPFRTLVFAIDRIRFQEPPERVEGIELNDR